MEFWGVEVKAGEPLSVCPDDGHLIHVSQVAMGEVKNVKGASNVPVRLKIDDKKFVIGTLSAENRPQLTFDLVFEKEFELSHDWKDGSIYFCGYTAEDPSQNEEEFPEGFSDDESEDEEEMLENGKQEPDVQAAKATKTKAAPAKPESSAKPKVTLMDPKKEEPDEDDDSDEEDDSIDESDEDDSDSDDDMSEDEETPTPKKPEPSKKRPSDSAMKTPASSKKQKAETPAKTDGKKGSAHTATPHPSKQEKKKVETPKSSGQVSCKTCSKSFNSEKGLESHTKAKHGGK